MTEVTKKAERLARALATVDNTLGFSVGFDRAYWGWPEYLEQAHQVIAAQNLLKSCEDIRPLHGCVGGANADKEIYYDHYTGPDSHNRATNLMLGLEADHG